MHRVHVVWTFFKIGLLNEFAYRANLYLQLIQSCAAGAMAFVGLIVVFGHTDTIGGWGPDEVLAVLGVYLVMGAAISGAIAPSMQKLMEDVRLGTLDYTLTKPEESQFLVSVGEFRVWKLVDAMIGVVVLGVALGRRGETLGAAEAALFGAMMVAGGTIIYSFFLTMGAVSFWFLRIEEHSPDLSQHVSGGALADRCISTMAAYHSCLCLTGGDCCHGTGRGSPITPYDRTDRGSCAGSTILIDCVPSDLASRSQTLLRCICIVA